MFKMLVVAASLTLSFPSLAQQEIATMSHAKRLLNQKSYADAVKVFQAVFAKKDADRGEYYDAACAAALAGQHDLAFVWLNKSIDKNWWNIDHLKTDSDLQSLHDRPEWLIMLNRLQTKLAAREKNYDHALKKELEDIFIADQKLRTSIDTVIKQYGENSEQVKATWDEIERLDAANLKRVTQILDSKGWLGPEQVGERASSTLFLVVQHANKAVWEKYLPMMRKAVQEKKASASSLALLEDRYLAFGLGKKQIYGSQLQTIDGVTKLMPVEDPDRLDERRAAVGLGPIAEYLQNWNLTWDLESYKRSLAEDEKKTINTKK